MWLVLLRTVFAKVVISRTPSLSYLRSAVVAPKSRPRLVDLLLADYIEHATHFPPPQHLYSHQEGSFLHLVLDNVDREAKAQALR